MSVDPGTETTQPKPKPKASPKSATPLKLGEAVIYTPSTTRANTLRSLRGIRNPEFVAFVVFIKDDGNADLWVLPPFGMAAHAAPNVPEGEGPHTFRRQ